MESNATINENDNEAIQEAMFELSTLRIIVVSDSNEDDDGTLLRIDRERLATIGYTLTFDGISPIFTKLTDLQYMYNPILWMSDHVPKNSLVTYSVSKMKCGYSSC